MASSFHTSHYPAGREFKPRDQSVPNDADGSSPGGSDSGDPASGNDPSPTPEPTDHFVPSSALNHPQPWNTQTRVSSTIVSTSNLPSSTSVTLPTTTLHPTPTSVPVQGKTSSTTSSNRKYIIGGAVGGGVLVLILLALLLFCCSKRRRKKDLERTGSDHSEEQHGYGQFTCCDHGSCNRNGGQTQMEQKTPLKPFILKSATVPPTFKGGPQRHNVALNRRGSSESQKSAGSDYSAKTLCSSDSEGPQRGKRRSQKRPPPLKLTSLVTPVIRGPQDNPRRKSDHSSPPSPHGVPTIIVDPPQSRTPEITRRY